MPLKDPILRNQNSNVVWNIILSTPHAVAYRLWSKQKGGDWVIIADGGLSDDVVDAGEFGAIKGTEFAYWLGIGSNKPQSSFDVSIILSQENIILIDGIMQEIGRVNDNGIAQRLESVTFR